MLRFSFCFFVFLSLILPVAAHAQWYTWSEPYRADDGYIFQKPEDAHTAFRAHRQAEPGLIFLGDSLKPDTLQGRWISRGCSVYEGSPHVSDSYGVDPETCSGPDLVRSTVIIYPDNALLSEIEFQESDQGRPDTELCVGNPIHLGTGNKYQVETDYRSAGLEPLVFERHYNSLAVGRGNESGFGRGWSHTYHRLVETNPEEYGRAWVVLHRPDGKRLAFYRYLDEWRPAVASSDRLYEDGAVLDALRLQQQVDVDEDSGERSISWVTLGDWARDGWTYVRGDGVIEQYGKNGRLVSIHYPSGNIVDVKYADGVLSEVSDSYGRSLSFTASGGLLVGMEDPAGESYTYSYDGSDLDSVTYPDGTSRVYLRDDPNAPAFLSGIEDEHGDRYATWGYDAEGRAVSSLHGQNADAVSLAFDDQSGSATVTNALGHERTYHFSERRGALRVDSVEGAPCVGFSGGTRSYTYNSAGFLSKVVDEEGGAATYSFDTNRDLETSRTGPQGQVTTSWHPQFDVPLLVREPKRETSYTYDADLRVTSKTVAEPYGVERTWTYTYHPPNAAGLVLLASVDGPRADVNDVTTYVYDAAGNVSQVINALGHVISFPSYDAHGNPLQMVDPNGVQWTFAYDKRGRLKSVTGPSGATLFDLDPVGLIESVQLPTGVTVHYEYDEAHRLVAIVDDLGNRREFVRDGLGNVLDERIEDAGGALHAAQSSIYNELGWLLEASTALGEREYEYNRVGSQTLERDALGHETTYQYDTFQRLSRITDAKGEYATLSYTSAGDVERIRDKGGVYTYYDRNAFGEVWRIRSPDTGITEFTFDLAGNVATRLDANGQLTEYAYDALNRLVEIDYGGAQPTVELIYDDPAASYGIGRLTEVRQGGVITRYGYDNSGKQVVETRTFPSGTSWTLGYSYDNAGELESITYPSGRVVTYNRDAAGQVSSVETTAGGTATTLASQVARAPFGPITSLTYGNGLTLSRSLDLHYRVTGIAVSGVLDRSYLYTVDGNIATIEDHLDPAASLAFGYDPVEQLISANAFSYSYDDNGNRLSFSDGVNGDILRYLRGKNQIASRFSGSLAYVHDSNGNIVSRGADTFVYDAENRLATATVGGVTASYDYDHRHLRSSKAVSGETTLFVYGPNGELLAEVDGDTGATIREYAWLDGQPLAFFTNSETYYVHNDHLGTPQRLTNTTGVVAWAATYAPFGRATITTSAVSFPLRFPGQYEDSESGLHYNWHRYYDPVTGRYFTSDPIRHAGGINPYVYGSANPLMWTDPTGLIIFNLGAGLFGGVIGATSAGVAAWWNGADATGVLTASGLGLITGFTAGVTFGAASSTFALSVLSSVSGNVGGQAISSSRVCLSQVALSALAGALGGGTTTLAVAARYSPVAESAVGSLASSATQLLFDIGYDVSNERCICL